MDRSTRILVVARPGHRRQSLVALLKTLNRAELFLIEDCDISILQPPNLVMVDLGGLHSLSEEVFKQAVQQWPTARKLALVDNIRQTSQAFALGADCALTYNTPAGELLFAVKQLCQEAESSFRIGQATALFAAI